MKSKNGLKKMTLSRSKDINFIELQKQYLRKCQVNNLSEYTIRYYEVSCRTFGKFINLEELKVSEIDSSLIDDYILHLKGTGIKDITINTYVRGITPIIKFGMELGLIKRFGFKEIRTMEEIKDVYSNSELEILFQKPISVMKPL